MTQEQAAYAISPLTKEQRAKWVMLLGYDLTIAARSCYVVGQGTGDPKILVAFNEIQHQVYQELLHSLRGNNWGPERLLDSLYHRAKAANCLSDVAWAIRNSLEQTTL